MCQCPTCFCWGDYGSQLAWEHLSVFPKEEVEGMTGREEGLGISAQMAAPVTCEEWGQFTANEQ